MPMPCRMRGSSDQIWKRRAQASQTVQKAVKARVGEPVALWAPKGGMTFGQCGKHRLLLPRCLKPVGEKRCSLRERWAQADPF